MPTDPISTLAVATGGAFLGKFVGPAAEHYGKLALERAQQLGAKATAYLTAVGREPQAVEPKVLLPLVQAAALETDETLAEKWAALLANAADPSSEQAASPVYVDILRQLTPSEAVLLDEMFIRVNGPESYVHPKFSEGFRFAHQRKNATSHILDLNRIFYECIPDAQLKGEDNLPNMSIRQQFDAMVDNFLRHQILTPGKEEVPKGTVLFSGELKPARNRVFFTLLGYNFMAACTPPK